MFPPCSPPDLTSGQQADASHATTHMLRPHSIPAVPAAVWQGRGRGEGGPPAASVPVVASSWASSWMWVVPACRAASASRPAPRECEGHGKILWGGRGIHPGGGMVEANH